MRKCILLIGLALAAATPAYADTIKPEQAQSHVGQTVTVEGAVTEVHHARSGRATFIDFGGRYPNNAFSAVIFARDAGKFPNVDALAGKSVEITGPVQLRRGKPEIILTEPAQLKSL
jgi:DNA/RNA endonuclease YhcR with UshA esterase domain